MRRIPLSLFVEMVMERFAPASETTSTWSTFAESYRSTMPIIYRYLSRGTAGNVQLAEELTQATSEVAVRCFRRGQPEALDLAWLHTVARHRLIDHYRRAKVEKAKLTILAGRRNNDVAVPSDLTTADAQAALQTLSSQHRLALLLRYVDDPPVAEVAELLDRSTRATESLLARARAALRAAYEERCDA
jgi:RNA polymerase sigma-70 factor (ECF subfamily)